MKQIEMDAENEWIDSAITGFGEPDKVKISNKGMNRMRCEEKK